MQIQLSYAPAANSAYPDANSAMRFVNNLLHESEPSPIPNPILRSAMESMFLQLTYLRPYLQNYTSMESINLRVCPIEEQIEHALDKLRDLIETHILSGRFLSKSETHKDEVNDYALFLSKELQEIQQEISSMTTQLMNKLELFNREDKKYKQLPSQPCASGHVISSRIYHAGAKDNNKPVGLDDELRQLIDTIMGNSDDRKMLGIAGMAGIGKTFLVQQIYDHPSIVSHFETRIMVTIGPSFTVREFLLLVLHHTQIDTFERLEKLEDEELKMHLRSLLNDRKCVIVVDDVWRSDIVGCLYWLLIDLGESKSQIIFTTRRSEIFSHKIHTKRFLNDESSWDLLHDMIFTDPDERCSHQLKIIGMQIAKNCEGLPLAIVSIAKLLSQNEKTVEFWKKVLEDENPLNIGVDDNTHISKSLYLSYKMLRNHHLKACFLYLGVIPKSYKISISNLTRLWIVEGFLKQEPGMAIEDVAQEILSELVSESVVLVDELSSIGRTKTCRIHTVFRSLCIGVAQKEEFCYVIKKYAYSFPKGTNQQARLCIHNNVVLSIQEVSSTLESIPCIRTLLCFGPQHTYPLHMHLNFPLLRTLDALRIRFYVFPDQVLKLVRLKYLALTCNGELPKSISRLWKLQVLILGRHYSIKSSNAPSYLPSEIWDLKWLRNLHCMGVDVPDLCTSSLGCDPSLKQLIALSGVGPRSCTPRVLARMPRLKKLGIQIELAPDEVENFNFLENIAQQFPRLKSFKCIVLGLSAQIIPMTPVFPFFISKITLSGCRFPWVYMTAIGSLPRLQVLKLRCRAFSGSVWEPLHEEFLQLKYLLLEDLDIADWRTHPDHFPSLECLIIRHCYKLHEIPTDVGYIQNLDIIEVEDCNPSVATSAEQIHDNINECVYVDIYSSLDESKRTLKPRKPRPFPSHYQQLRMRS